MRLQNSKTFEIIYHTKLYVCKSKEFPQINQVHSSVSHLLKSEPIFLQ